MARNSLSALDFIINVLREHEKELADLSEKLENTLTVLRGEDLRRTLGELGNSVQVLSETIKSLSEKIDSQVNADMRLKEESQRQRAQINDILNRLDALPTRDDLTDLRRGVDALNTLLASKDQKPIALPKG